MEGTLNETVLVPGTPLGFDKLGDCFRELHRRHAERGRTGAT
jgi:hypothetical protein